MKNRMPSGFPRLPVFALIAAGFHAALPAQDNALPSPGLITSDVSIIKAKRVTFGTQQAYDIADGVTFEIKDTLLAAGNGAIFDLSLSASADMFHIRPATDAAEQSGRFIFSNNRSNAYSGVGHISRGTLVLNNGIIINNYAATHGGVFTLGANGILRATNILFQGNSNGAGSGGSVISFRSNIAGRPPSTITSSTFLGNYSLHTANDTGGGMLDFATGSVDLTIKDSAFINNRTGHSGAAILFRINTSDVMLQDVTTISGNWAGVSGGFLYDRPGIGNAAKPIVISLSSALAGRHIVYENNAALGVSAQGSASIVTAAEVTSGTWLPARAPKAANGGFYFTNNFGNLRFNIAGDVTLSIGRAGNNTALDSIATADSANGYKTIMDKVGAGRLILNADNAHFQGTTNVQAGSLILGNEKASLGGVINIHSGAALGGSGTLTTLRANNTISASPNQTFVSATTNAFLQVGMETAVDAEKLIISGSLRMLDGFMISHDLFASGSASFLQVNHISLVGSGTINLGLLATGSFVLAKWDAGGVNPGQLTLTIDGVASNPRSSGALIVDDVNKQLIVSNTVNNLQMKWTGANGSAWLRRPTDEERNWADLSASGENRFYNGDSVIFDGTADAAHAGNRVITIETGGVTISGMEVSGDARYEFRGDGGITASAGAVGSAQFAPAGKMVKSGGAELVFANDAANTFAGGIDISGGRITFGSARQLGTGTGGIAFIESATLHATKSVNTGGTITGGMGIAAGKTAELVVDQGGTLVYNGALASGGAGSTFRKSGAGALLLAGDSSANTGNVSLDAGVVTLAAAGAGLGGKITVASGVTLGGIGTAGANGSVKIASGAMLDVGVSAAQSGTLTVTNLELTGGGVVRVGLFSDAAEAGYKKSDRLIDAGASAISGSNLIDLESFASGTFNLGNVTGLASNSSVTISGMTLPASGRLSATVSDNGGVLQLVASSDKSRRVAWTGAGGTTWNLVEGNWAGTESASTFSYGDHVVFDGVADAAHAGGRSIAINATEVRISDMTVEGGADYLFAGGGIAVSAGHVLANASGEIELAGATGRLVKSGAGTLTFANSGNLFEGGVNLDGGVIAISHGGQLRTGAAAGITFAGGGTIRALAGGVALDDDFLIDAGVTGAFDTNGQGMTLQGSVTGAADSFFEKTGAGALVLGADVSAHAGAIAVRGGSLVVTGEDVLGAAADIVVDAGAVLDLAGHNQSLSRLNGAGEVALGGADLKMTVDVDAAFAGGFSGEGKVYKNGAGKWTLSGSSSHTGGFDYEAGTLGLAGSHALGAGAVTAKTAGPVISIEAGGLAIPNDFNLGENNTVISNNGYDVEFSGALAGTGEIRAGGSGVTTLSGRNSYANLIVETPRLVMRRSEAASNRVTINTGSVLEFQSVPGGDVNGILAGDRVLFTSSTLTLRGANAVRDFEVVGGSLLTIEGASALGGSGADVVVRQGSALRIIKPEVAARNMLVDGGALVFANYYEMTALKLAGIMEFANNGEVRLGALLPTGIYTAAIAEGGIPGMPYYNPNQEGMFMVVDIIDGKKLQLTAYNMALEPGKDIVVGFDSMLASMRAIYSRVSEEFLSPVINRKPGASSEAFWTRFIGSFAEYGDDISHLGYTDRTHTALAGCDWITGNNYMLGIYGGFNNTNLETTNNAATDVGTACFGAYGAKRAGDFYASLDLLGGFGSADTVRREDQGNVVTGGYDITSFGASLEIGAMLHPFSNGGLRPGIGLHYMNLNLRNYSETGVGAVRLGGTRAYSLEAVFACDASREIKMPWGRPGMVDIRLGWRENLNTGQSEIWATMVDYPAARMRIRGDSYDGSGITCGVGLRMGLGRGTLFALAYDFDYIPMGAHDNDTTRHTLNGVVRVSW